MIVCLLVGIPFLKGGEEVNRIAVDSEEGDSHTYVTTHFTARFSSKAKNT